MFFFFASLSLPLWAQSKVGFAYDAAGNRVKRELVLKKTSRMTLSETMPSESFFEDIGNCSVKLTSNDLSGILKVTFLNIKDEDKCDIGVYTMSGIKIYGTKAEKEEYTIDISGEPSGVYTLRITVNGTPTTWKITKK